MNQQQLSLSHDECTVMLPLYVHGKLDAQDQLSVVDHLRHCKLCQAELHLANRVRDHFHHNSEALTSALSPERVSANFDRLWTQIETEQAANSANNGFLVQYKNPSWSQHLDRIRYGLAAGFSFVILFAFIAVVIGWYTQQVHTDNPLPGYEQSQIFHTLGSPPPNGDLQAIRAVFADDMPQRTLQELLAKCQAQIVSGPSAEGVYTLKVNNPKSAIAQLRANPRVLLAEPSSYE